MKINNSTQLLIALSLIVGTFLSAIPISAKASAGTDSTVVRVEHLQLLDDTSFLSDDEVLATRWMATADFYSDKGLLINEAPGDATVVRVKHLQYLDNATFFSDDAVLAARWMATGSFYADSDLLINEAIADTTVIRVEHLKHLNGVSFLSDDALLAAR